jgi:DNA-binding FadR family transcriptional regulator
MTSRRRTPRISERITRSIRRQIAAGKLVPGEKLPPEREMARRYQVSRASVREAFRALEQLGLVSIRRGSHGGAFVTEPGRAAVHELRSLLLRLARSSDRELMDALMIQPSLRQIAARRPRRAAAGALTDPAGVSERAA